MAIAAFECHFGDPVWVETAAKVPTYAILFVANLFIVIDVLFSKELILDAGWMLKNYLRLITLQK